MVTLTREFIFKGASARRRGWNRAQLAAIGVAWPPVKGWLSRMIGQQIDDEQAQRFTALRGSGGRARRRTSRGKSERARVTEQGC